MTTAYLVAAALVLTSAIVAVRSRELIRSAGALIVSSSGLALMFYLLQAPYASAIQLSVGAGLVSTLFIIAISLAESIGRRREQETRDNSPGS